MEISDPEVNDAISRRWRGQLAVVAFIFLAGGVAGILVAVGYGTAPWVAICFLLGGLAVLGAVGSVPRGVTVADRPAMKATALWIVLALVLLVGGPLLLIQLGLT